MHVHMVTIEDVPEIAMKLKDKLIGYDVETTGLDPRLFRMVTIQFGTLQDVYILDCRGYTPDAYNLWHANLQSLFDTIAGVVGTNLAYDFIALRHHFGVNVKNMHDIMNQELIIVGEGWSSARKAGHNVSLKGLGDKYGYTISKEETIWFVDLDQRPVEWHAPFPQEQIDYCVQDVIVPLGIHAQQEEKLKELGMVNVAKLENMAIDPVAKIGYNGCKLDVEKWETALDGMRVELVKVEEEIKSLLGNYWGRQSIQDNYEHMYNELISWRESIYLYEKYAHKQCKEEGAVWRDYRKMALTLFKEKYPEPAKPPKVPSELNIRSTKMLLMALQRYGVPIESTSKAVLDKHKNDFPIIARILHYRELDKMIASFGNALLKKIGIDGRIHPQYIQIGAATGRMSCKDPNWQQIPSRNKTLRKCIIAEVGYKLLTADFSNIEMRILADLSGDKNMLMIFANGGDLHSWTARLMFSLDATDDEIKGTDDKVIDSVVTEKGVPALLWQGNIAFRDAAKTIGFGLVYGMSTIGLARTLGVSEKVAYDLMQQYFEAYPDVQKWLDGTADNALQDGYASTVLGRKRFYSWTYEQAKRLKVTKYALKGMLSRQAKNSPIQGTSADVTKHALILVDQMLPEGAKIVACVHDELVVECPEHLVEEAKWALQQGMHDACRYHLRRVALPSPEETKVSVEDYWKK